MNYGIAILRSTLWYTLFRYVLFILLRECFHTDCRVLVVSDTQRCILPNPVFSHDWLTIPLKQPIAEFRQMWGMKDQWSSGLSPRRVHRAQALRMNLVITVDLRLAYTFSESQGHISAIIDHCVNTPAIVLNYRMAIESWLASNLRVQYYLIRRRMKNKASVVSIHQYTVFRTYWAVTVALLRG